LTARIRCYHLFEITIACTLVAPSNPPSSTLDNPVFAVMELHRFEAHINDNQGEGEEDVDVHLEGPANEKKFVDVFDAAYLLSPRAQSVESFQRVNSSSAPNAAAQRMAPRGFGQGRGGGGRGRR